jgi:exodeoxyribonuclease-3
MIRISTWNVNSLRARIPNLMDWIKKTNPDVVLLQEIKCSDEQFPILELSELNYNIIFKGQKSYNGVAIM